MGTVFIRHMKPRVYFSSAWQRWLIENTQSAPNYVVIAAQDMANHLNSLPRQSQSCAGEKPG